MEQNPKPNQRKSVDCVQQQKHKPKSLKWTAWIGWFITTFISLPFGMFYFFLDENTSKTTTFFIAEKTHSLLRQNHFPYSQNVLNLWFHSIACSSIPFLLLLNRSIVLLNIFFHSLWESATPFLSGKTLIRCTFKIIAADTFHVIPKAKTNFKFRDFICCFARPESLSASFWYKTTYFLVNSTSFVGI